MRGGNRARASLLLEQWLLIEWPDNQAEPETYYLSTRPANSTLSELVNAAHQRWRIERDYQDLKSRTWEPLAKPSRRIGISRHQGKFDE